MKWLCISVLLCLFAAEVKAQNRPVSGDAVYNIVPALINGHPPNLPAGTTINGVAPASYSFTDSLLLSLGVVTLVNDSASPGNSKYYGTNGSGTRGYFDLPESGGIGGSIADQQVAFGVGTDIGGDDGLMWSNNALDKTLNITSANGPALNVSVTGSTGNVAVNATVLGSDTHAIDATAINTLFGSPIYGVVAFMGADGVVCTKAYGFYAYTPSLLNSGTITDNYGVYVDNQNNATGITTSYGLWAANQTGGAANAYFLWYDSPGVYRIKNDGVMAYYNPAFSPKYTPGATDYERVVQQWNSNVLEYGTEAGGTGTSRAVRIIGPQVKVANLTTNGYVKTTGSDGTLVVVTPTPSATATATATATPTATPTATVTQGFTAHFNNGGAAIANDTTTVTPWTCPYSGTITGWSISVDSGTCTLKTWKKANGTAIPTVADNINTSGVSISTGTHIRSSTVSDFTTTTVTAGDMFMATVTATTGPTDITFQVEITR